MASDKRKKYLALAELTPRQKRQSKNQDLLLGHAGSCLVRTPLPEITAKRDTEKGILNLALPESRSDNALAKAILSRACGTTYEDLWQQIISQALVALQPKQGEEQSTINSLLAVMLESEPEDPIEAMLLSQTVVVHGFTMKHLAAAAKEGDPELSIHRQNMASKYLRLFQAQLQALIRYRGANKPQRIVVKHVHVHRGGQAVIAGNITSNGKGGPGGPS